MKYSEHSHNYEATSQQGNVVFTVASSLRIRNNFAKFRYLTCWVSDRFAINCGYWLAINNSTQREPQTNTITNTESSIRFDSSVNSERENGTINSPLFDIILLGNHFGKIIIIYYQNTQNIQNFIIQLKVIWTRWEQMFSEPGTLNAHDNCISVVHVGRAWVN